MPYTPGEEPGKVNREWIFAEYATDSLGVRRKVPGTGVEVDRVTRAVIPNRGFNRPDQRYELDPGEIRSRRAARALAEKDDCLAIRMDGGRVEVVSASENRYDVSGPDQDDFCACPDFLRLGASYPGEGIVCKHILIARIKEAERDPLPLDVGVLYIAEQIGIAFQTVQQACRKGICIASKIKRTWVITPDDADTFITLYRTNMHDPDFMAQFRETVTALMSNPSGRA